MVTEQWGYTEVATHIGVTKATVRKYASLGIVPAPDGRIGVTSWWHPDTIREWHATRPSQCVCGSSGQSRVVQQCPDE